MILMDSVLSNTISNNECPVSVTPFIDQLMKDGFFTPTIISSGPYTDAATKSLYSGTKGLNNGGYYFQMNSSPTNHYKVFKELGYETYGFYYPYYLNGEGILKNIDHSIYLSGILFESIWDGKLKYYSDLLKNKTISEFDYLMLEHIFDIVFQAWGSFYSTILSDFESRVLIEKLIQGINVNELKNNLDNQKSLFLKNKRKYITEVLELGYGHPIATLEKIDASKFVDKHFVKTKIYKKHSSFFRFSSKICYKCNKKNLSFSRKKALDGIVRVFKKGSIREARYYINYLRCLYSIAELKKASLSKKWKNIASAGSQISAFSKILKNRSSDKPFFASMHFLESHHSISFFSYDLVDENEIDNEIEYIESVARTIPDSFKGNLSYYYSLIYTDYCVKKLFDALKDSGLLNSTTVVLFADHGTSYTYSPIRTNMVNTFHRENYNVPMIIYGPSINGRVLKNKSYYESIDMMPTILDILGEKIPTEMDGKSILANNESNRIVITEYMGPGCPDMQKREIWISARDFNYTIGCKVKLGSSIERDNIYCIYDTTIDKDELRNYATDETYLPKTNYLLDAIKHRLLEIENDYNTYLSKLCINNNIQNDNKRF